MPWTWIRLADPALLADRPLLDLGAGDAATLQSLAPEGPAVAVDASWEALRAARRTTSRPLVQAAADRLPFREAAFRTVLAADLFHHLDDRALAGVAAEARRVLARGGRLVAWWYEAQGRAGGPAFPRPYEVVARAVLGAGFGRACPLELVPSSAFVAPTTGVVATASD